MDLKFINRKKGTVLLHDGRQYYKLRTYKNGNVFWTCSNLKKQKCRGSITLKNDQIVKCGDHSCTADYAKNEMDAAMDALKKTATSTSLPIPQLYRETKNVLKDRGLNFVRIIPSFDNIKSTLYSRRSKTCFKNIAEVSIPDQLRFFLLAEYSTENSKILVFCSEHGKELLAKPNEFFCDGTFFSCPKPFKQMYSIHADVAQSRLTTNLNPAAYALMTDKKEESYTALFQIIKSQIPQWTPKKIHIDFETAASNALIQIFPNLHIKKCYYHFTKSLWKRAKELKIQSKIQNRIVGLCSILPLLPVDEIDAGWEYIISECHKNDKIEKFIKYFEKTWLKDKSFISEWSVFGERHRSNNAVESWHAQLNHQMKKYRPITISRLLSTLLKMEDDHATNGDNEPSPRRNEHISRDDFIMKCQLEFLHKEISIGHFLDKLR